MGKLLLLGAGFGYMVLLIETVRALTDWWGGEIAPGPLHWGALLLAPALAWVWWRRLSVFRCSGACTVPEAGRKEE